MSHMNVPWSEASVGTLFINTSQDPNMWLLHRWFMSQYLDHLPAVTSDVPCYICSSSYLSLFNVKQEKEKNHDTVAQFGFPSDFSAGATQPPSDVLCRCAGDGWRGQLLVHQPHAATWLSSHRQLLEAACLGSSSLPVTYPSVSVYYLRNYATFFIAAESRIK